MVKDHLRFIPLRELIAKKESYEAVRKILLSFKCKRDRDIEKFLKEKAVDFERRKICRTYLWIDIQNKQVAGYFSIGLDVINLEGLSNTLKRKLNKGFYPNSDFLFTYLIGQIGRSDAYSSQDISGKEILDTALIKIKEAQNIVGGIIVSLDIMNPNEKPKLEKLYLDYGFKELKLINTNLKRYFLILK